MDSVCQPGRPSQTHTCQTHQSVAEDCVHQVYEGMVMGGTPCVVHLIEQKMCRQRWGLDIEEREEIWVGKGQIRGQELTKAPQNNLHQLARGVMDGRHLTKRIFKKNMVGWTEVEISYRDHQEIHHQTLDQNSCCLGVPAYL